MRIGYPLGHFLCIYWNYKVHQCYQKIRNSFVFCGLAMAGIHSVSFTEFFIESEIEEFD